MAFQLFKLPPQQPLSAAGRVLPGSKLYFYLTGTSTPTPVYTTSALNVAHSQPLVADSGGRFDPVYLDPTITYKATVTDANDVLLYTNDPVNDQLLSQGIIGEYLHPRTDAEQSAGVTPANPAFQTFELRRYGNTACTGGDDTAAWADAIGVAEQYAIAYGGCEITFDGPSQSEEIALPAGVSIRGIGNPTLELIASSATDVAIRAQGSVGAAQPLSANADQGAMSVTVASSAGLSTGWALIREETYVATVGMTDVGRKQEIVRIIDIAGGVVTLANNLQESYTTAASAEICALSACAGFKLSNFGILVPDASNGGCVDLEYAAGFRIKDLDLRGANTAPSLKSTTSAYGWVDGLWMREGQNLAPGGSNGLGLYLTEASHNLRFTSLQQLGICQSSIETRCRHIQVIGCLSRGTADTAINTHGNGSSHILLSDWLIDGAGGHGAAIGYSANVAGDRDVTLRNFKVRNAAQHGISVVSASGVEHQRIVLENVEVEAFGLIGNAGTYHGIRMQYADDCDLSRVRVDAATIGSGDDPAAGICAIQCGSLTVNRARVANVANGYGLQIDNCDDYEVSECRFKNVSASNVITTNSTGTNRVRFNRADDATVSIEATVDAYGNSWDKASSLKVLCGSKTYNPGLFSDGSGTTTTVTCTGAALGDFAEASGSIDYQGVLVRAWVSAADTVSVRFQNETGGDVTIGSHTLRVRVRELGAAE